MIISNLNWQNVEQCINKKKTEKTKEETKAHPGQAEAQEHVDGVAAVDVAHRAVRRGLHNGSRLRGKAS